MSSGFFLKSNSLCGDLPTELASLLLPGDLDRREMTDGNFIGSPCLPSSSADNSNTQTSGIAATIRVLGGVGLAIAITVLAALVGYRCATRAKSRAASDDDNESIISNTSQTPLLHGSDLLDLESNGSGMRLDIDPDADGPEHGLQLQPLALPDQPSHLAHDWQRSGAQLLVLDHELRVVLWSMGMAEATSSFTPAPGTSVEGLPFPSVDVQRNVVHSLELIMRERGAEGEAALHPTLALQAAVMTAPNVTMHLAALLSNGVREGVLLSMTAIKMKPLSAAASPHGFDNEACHLLIMGRKTLDPGLASLLSHDSKVASPSTISDLTSESGTASGRSKSSSSNSDGPGAAGGDARSRRRRLDDSTVYSRDTADILAPYNISHHNPEGAVNTDGSTVGSINTAEQIAARSRRRMYTWRRVRPRLLVVARFGRMLARARRLADLRRVLDRAAGGLIIDELVVREIAAHLGLLPLLPPHEPSQQRATLIDLDLQPILESERRRRF